MNTKKIQIPTTATKSEIAAWARGQMARLGQPVDPCFGDDAAIGVLVFYLVVDQQQPLAARIADQVGLTDLAAAVRRNADRHAIAA